MPSDAVSVELVLDVDKAQDQGLVEFTRRLLPPESSETALEAPQVLVRISVRVSAGSPEAVECHVNSTKLDKVGASEMLKRCRSSSLLRFHNSTSMAPWAYRARDTMTSATGRVPDALRKKLAQKRTSLQNAMTKALRPEQAELEQLLGRLGEKYSVSLSGPELDFEEWPVEISLGEKLFNVPLDEWGSGTRNRTLVLRSLFSAKRASQDPDLSNRITPLVIIEEPECFLHPLAQARFGRVLQDLSEELRIQVIVTTHSPYMLSHKEPESNVLIRRRVHKKAQRASEVIVAKDEHWRRPFEHVLGVVGPEFELFKHAVFSRSSSVIMVEGQTDAAYLDLMRDDAHGDRKLHAGPEVFPYEGIGNLENQILVKFVRERFSRFVLTFDLDSEGKLRRLIESLGLRRDVDFVPVGLNKPGCRAIEGLVPEAIKARVNQAHGDLVTAALSDDKDEARAAKDSLKRAYLAKFTEDAKPGTADYVEFYRLADRINKALRMPR